MKKTIYIHIPFCKKKCHYCAFYSTSYDEKLATEYINTLCEQIKSLLGKFYTVYIGGGTPTILSINLWRKLFSALRKVSMSTEEITIEANPESINKEKLKLFRDCGVNRLSIGIQSFSQKNLKLLGRIHSAKQAIDSILLAEKLGFSNINIDLIFGVWGQRLEHWQQDLETTTQLPVKHISTYALSIEDKTFFSGKNLLDEDLSAKMYKYSMEHLPKKGFSHYETSNFSKKNYACKHNLHYWDNGTYVGLGPSAASYQANKRCQNISDVSVYIERIKSNRSPVVFTEKLSALNRAKELAVLKLRTKEGVDFNDFKNKTGVELRDVKKDTLAKLVDFGLLRYRKNNKKPVGIALTKKGFLFSDTVSVELL